MPCTESYATIQEFANFWAIDCTEIEAQVIAQMVIDVTAGNIYAALASVAACDCTLASWAPNWLQKINILEAGVMYNSRCGRPALTDDAKRMYLEWVDAQLALVREGKIDLCDGHTGADWPSIGWASQALTERQAAEIIANDIERNA